MQFYISETNEIFSVGDIVSNGTEEYIIKKFINHHKRKNYNEIYLKVNLQSVKYKTKNYTLPIEHLGNIYKK